MNFYDLPENYTKVSYRNPLIIEPKKPEITKKPFKFPKTLIKLIIAGAVFYFTMDTSVFAATGMEEKAERLYFDKFIGIVKWVIIGKGGWDIVNKALKEDFDGAKKGVLQYLLIFGVLMGLPKALNLVEDIFKGEA